MAAEEGDITALRHELTQELGQDDLVEEEEAPRPRWQSGTNTMASTIALS